MQEVHPRVFVTNEADCQLGSSDLAIVHACKSPCHQRVVGYKGSLSADHPNYLVLKEEFDLYLNIIDPPYPLFKPELFSAFLEFAEASYNSGRKLMIHCNKGESRAPSLALLFLAKKLSVLSDESYESAVADFMKIYPNYNPGKGIKKYFSDNWNHLGTNF